MTTTRDPESHDGIVRDFVRSMPFELRDATAGSDGLTLDGYAAVFNSPTLIDSYREGRFNEQIAPGAFARTIKAKTPVLQFDHGQHPMIGSIPLGRISTLEEDARGLHVVARVSDNWLTQPVRDAIAEGSIDGMSFRFGAIQEQWTTADGEPLTNDFDIERAIFASNGPPPNRKLLEVKVPELGPVVFPAYTDTAVGMRSVTIDLGRLHDPSEQSKLARAVYLADAGVASEGTRDERPADHAASTDSPQPTDVESPGEHESRNHLRMPAKCRAIHELVTTKEN